MAQNKILLIAESLKVGGAEKIIASLATALHQEGFSVSIISFFSQYDDEIILPLHRRNIETIFLDKKKGVDGTIRKKLIKEILRIQPDVIHTHFANHLKYVLPLPNSRMKHVHTLHNDYLKYYGKIKTGIYFWIMKQSHTIPVNISTKLNIAFNRLPGAEVIFNGITLLKPLNIDRVPFQILSVGRLVEQKNQVLLLRAFQLIQQNCKAAKLIVAGTGKEENNLKKTARDLGVANNVEFLGQCKDVRKLMSSSSVFVCSSKWEGMPLVLIEALNNGCPVVATNVGGVSDVVTPDVGVLTSADPKDISEKVIELLLDNRKLGLMSKNARLRAKEFSAEKMAEQYLKLYERILEK